MGRGLWIPTWLLVALSPLWAESTRLVPMNYADARQIASYLGGLVPGLGDNPAAPTAFARRSLARALQTLPQGADQWHQNLEARVTPEAGGGALVRVPAGLTQPPVALPQQNAILLRGSLEAIDQTVELIRLLDRPIPMINVELKLLDEPTEAVEEWGLDFVGLGNGVEVGSAGNAPAAGLQLRWARGNVGLMPGWDIRAGRGRQQTGASVTTFNNTPARVSFGETFPFFVSRISYDALGNRQVDTETRAIFAGIELFVHPRITGQDTINLRLRPTLSEGAGVVTAPDGSALPLIQTAYAETQVRVRDGESVVIAGFGHYNDSQTDRFRSLLGAKTLNRSSHPVLIVTPHIIREE